MPIALLSMAGGAVVWGPAGLLSSPALVAAAIMVVNAWGSEND
jgi:predicted PurR-regulated permease PerM